MFTNFEKIALADSLVVLLLEKKKTTRTNENYRGERKMGKSLLRTLLLAVLLAIPMQAQAEISVGFNISLPPPLYFSGPPDLVVLPGTYVYAAPDLDQDIFFHSGWWWRPWGGHWYRSRHYNSGWSYYRHAPSFYRNIPPRWRHDYREHRWRGRPWDYRRVPHHELHRNWQKWERNRHWDKPRGWEKRGGHSPARSLHPSREMESRQHRPQMRDADPRRSQHNPRGAQHYRGDRDRRENVRHDRRPGSNNPPEVRQSRQPRPQATEVRSGRSHKSHDKSKGEEDEHRRRR